MRKVLADAPPQAARLTIAALAETHELAAATVLAEWAGDARPEVRDAIASSWWQFDPEVFADVVLPSFADVADPPRLTIGPAQWHCADRFQWVRDIILLDPPTGHWRLPEARLERLRVEGFRGTTINLANCKRLTALDITQGHSLQDVNGLGQLNALRRVSLSNCPRWQAGVRLPPTVEQLEIEHLPLLASVDLTGAVLRLLAIRSCPKLEILGRPQMEFLEHVSLGGVEWHGVDWLEECEALRTLSMNTYGGERIPLKAARQLETLELVHCPRVTAIDWPRSDVLTRVRVSGASRLTDIRELVSCPQLEELDVSFCTNLTDISPLRHLRKLKHVDLTGCGSGLDLSAVGHVAHIDFPYPA